MAFESGSIGFRAFYCGARLPGDAVARFARLAAPPLDEIGRDPAMGWVTGRHLLDRHINEDTAHVAGYLRLTLMRAARKVPESLLRAECTMEELAEIQARGVPFLKRDVRAAIRKAVVERLQPTMPPTLTGIPFVYDEPHQMVYAGATGDAQMDLLVTVFEKTTGVALIPLTPETAAMNRRRVNHRDVLPASFSPEVEDALAEPSLGHDFLTWVWYFAEAGGGLYKVGDDQFGVIVEGPLSFVFQGEGAHETILRKGMPLISLEAKTALLGGKKLRAARLTLVRGEETWRATVDGGAFIFRGLRLPDVEALDPVSRFQERMLALRTFMEAYLALFDRFLAERADGKGWRDAQRRIHDWVRGRRAQR